MSIKPSSQNVYKKYVSSKLHTSDPMQLVVLLYEEAIKCVNVAMDKMEYRTYDLVNQNLIKAIEIISELRYSLDMKAGGQIAERLDAIYEYLLKEIRKANMEKSQQSLIHIKKILVEILESWKQVAHHSKTKGQQNDKSYEGGFSIIG